MASLLEELFHDLVRRAKEIGDELEKCPSSDLKEVDDYRRQMLERARRATTIANDILDDPDLNDVLFSPSYFRDFRDLARLVHALEHLPLLVLRRFDERDKALTQLMQRICAEANYPYQAPICSSLSSQYFWTMPDMDLIFVPTLEPERLLGIPDIYHEVGHICLFRAEKKIKGLILGVIESHFDRLRKQAKVANWASESIEELDYYLHQWRTTWWLEFGADLIATFLVGPAFGWCNIRTSVSLGGELFSGGDSHPADDARATAVGLFLEKLGAKDEANAIRKKWSELLSLSNESKPPRYDVAYPESLIGELCDLVFKFCKDLGLEQWSTDLAGKETIVGHVHRAWSKFQASPQEFVGYERGMLQKLGFLQPL